MIASAVAISLSVTAAVIGPVSIVLKSNKTFFQLHKNIVLPENAFLFCAVCIIFHWIVDSVCQSEGVIKFECVMLTSLLATFECFVT